MPISHTIRQLEIALVALQGFRVLFLWLHDWVPIGSLNDIAAVRSADSKERLVVVTLIQSVPFTVGWLFSLLDFGPFYRYWLYTWVWISYGLLLLGQIRAWWIPYLIRAEPERAARYRIMFGKTHSFLPQHHGLVPNTAHILLHLSTAATLILLFAQRHRL
jgi:hypothetical protein